MNPTRLILGLLPLRLRPYAKTVVSALTIALAIVPQVLPFLPDAPANVVSSIVLLLNALGVYAVKNDNLGEGELPGEG